MRLETRALAATDIFNCAQLTDNVSLFKVTYRNKMLHISFYFCTYLRFRKKKFNVVKLLNLIIHPII